MTFLDGEASDFNTWRESSESGVPQSWVIGINGYCYKKGYGYGSGSYPSYIAAIDRTVDGPGSDTDPPYVYYDFPNPGDTDVNPLTSILGRLNDDGFGIDVDTATFEVTYAGSGGPIDGSLTEESGSNFLDFKLKFEPDNPLPEYTEITVDIWAEDLLGNSDTTTWSFTTGELVGIKSVSLGELKAVFK